MTKELEKKMKALIDKLNTASDSYYNGMGETMTDFEWDSLFDQLTTLEKETGIIFPDSPTQHVSEDNFSGQKISHEYPALSLAKTKSIEDIVKWAENRPIWISWKLDGLTLVVTYDNGKLTHVVTRGNGHEGTNITYLAKGINGIPTTINYKGHVVIRGEAVISYDDFERFNLESGEAYANPRNLASGSLALKDVNEIRQRCIQWIPFTLVYIDEEINSWGKRIAWLAKQGFIPVDREEVIEPSIINLENSIGKWTEQVIKKKNPYPVDGLVITYNDTDYANTGSVTGHHATRSGLAFKWADESVKTKLIHIEWSCAVSTISPVAVFEAVDLEGTTVKRASLCNISECKRLGIGGAGTELEVIKANKIIPKVIAVDKTIGKLEIPKYCPICHHPTEIRESEGSKTETLHCTNENCPAKELKKISRFVSKAGMNIEGISEQTLDKFINLGWIKTFADIYRLKFHEQEIKQMEGFGEKSANNMIKAIEKARVADPRKFLFALNIPMCGQDVCKRLLEKYNIEDLIHHIDTSTPPDFFSDIPGIGPEKSSSIVNWFQQNSNKNKVIDLISEISFTEIPLESKGNSCNGLTFVITGNLVHYKNRNELKTYIEQQGGKVTGNISKSTNFLINNDINSTSKKNKDARELGIQILSEKEFIEKFV